MKSIETHWNFRSSDGFRWSTKPRIFPEIYLAFILSITLWSFPWILEGFIQKYFLEIFAGIPEAVTEDDFLGIFSDAYLGGSPGEFLQKNVHRLLLQYFQEIIKGFHQSIRLQFFLKKNVSRNSTKSLPRKFFRCVPRKFSRNSS